MVESALREAAYEPSKKTKKSKLDALDDDESVVGRQTSSMDKKGADHDSFYQEFVDAMKESLSSTLKPKKGNEPGGEKRKENTQQNDVGKEVTDELLRKKKPYQRKKFRKSESNISKAKRCWNCGEDDHWFNDCKAERKLFCYSCGYPEVKTPDCTRCKRKPDEKKGNEKQDA